MMKKPPSRREVKRPCTLRYGVLGSMILSAPDQEMDDWNGFCYQRIYWREINSITGCCRSIWTSSRDPENTLVAPDAAYVVQFARRMRPAWRTDSWKTHRDQRRFVLLQSMPKAICGLQEHPMATQCRCALPARAHIRSVFPWLVVRGSRSIDELGGQHRGKIWLYSSRHPFFPKVSPL